MNKISIENIEFSFSDKNSGELFKLKVDELNIKQGDFLSILGPNGSGKTTLLKLLSGINKPTVGSIKYDDKNYNEFSIKDLSKKIAYVPQSIYSVFPFSVYEIVMMGRTPHLNLMGFESEEDRQIVNDVLDIVDINKIKHKSINEVSGGEAQRAFIARALAQSADVILLDEPSSHLDVSHQISIYRLLKSLNQDQNKTIVIVSHDLNLSGTFSNRGMLMKGGRVIKDDDIKSLLTEQTIEEVFDVKSSVYFDEKNDVINVMLKA